MSPKRGVVLVLLIALAVLGAASPAPAQPAKAGVIYAPLYQRAVIDHRGRILELAATAYVRNPNQARGLHVQSMVIYNGQGKQMARLIGSPRLLGPLSSLRLLVPHLPTDQGAPSLVVRWRSDNPVAPPLVEVLMMGTAGQQGISLTTTGTPLPAGP
ncbi:MAG: DUF3124 domain-containing protein [Desulfarculaceae bacterium]|nr:DUF3124 domain-containing protein [Desulfarculaceae bacterium]MCF8072486.1 DUF3124 domain-containing protein [Desulfarculaceae bacterium]MCF8102947.1 DUF3124 domain-containing protein [Desulfarculaceae bacterium]MCF8117027.1 DUF3124 domain-containing protein [Desulfarculaceae bacterium]